MFLRSVSLFTLTMAIIGAAHGADQGRKEEALAFLKSIGGGVHVSETLKLVISKYSCVKETTRRECLKTLVTQEVPTKKLSLKGSISTDRNYDFFEYFGTYDDNKLEEKDKFEFNVNFCEVEKAEKKRLNKEALAFLTDKPFPRIQKMLKRELGL